MKWMVLCAGVVMQMILGGIYAWSEFVPLLQNDYGLSKSQSGLIFGATIAMFTLVMIPAGRLLQRAGVRFVAMSGALLFGLGYLGASFSEGSFPLLFICLSGITGAGIGLGYICPLTVSMKWFPDNKGLVTGVSVAGFGGGAVALSALAEHLLTGSGMDVMEVFRIIGLGSGGLALAAALLLREPNEAAASAAETAKDGAARPVGAGSGLLLSRNFLLICLGMFSGTFAGLLVVGNLKPIALSMGLGSAAATLCISLFALGNAIGRIGWGQVHDRLGTRPSIVLSLAYLGLSLALLLMANSEFVVLAAVLLTGIGFGGCFVVYASSVVELYGVQLFPRLYPVCFLWYGLAALAGPPLGGMFADASGTYTPAIALSAVVVLLSAPAIWTLFRVPRAALPHSSGA